MKNSYKTLDNHVICIGTQRAATTWLFELLRGSSDFVSPKVKEIDFFRDLGNWRKGDEYYFSILNSEKLGSKLTFDITPEYCISEEAILRIKDIEHLKVLFIIRNPIKRIISAYQKHKRNDVIGCDIDEFIKYEYDNCIRRSRYCSTISLLEKSKIDYKILIYEDIQANETKEVKSISDFLDVDLLNSSALNKKYNISSRPTPFATLVNTVGRNMDRFHTLKKLKKELQRRDFINGLLQKYYKSDDRELYLDLFKKYSHLFLNDISETSIQLNRDLKKIWGYEV